MAGYIMDKFAFKDLIFNIDCVLTVLTQTNGLKDKYLFYEARTADQVTNLGASGNIPEMLLFMLIMLIIQLKFLDTFRRCMV